MWYVGWNRPRSLHELTNILWQVLAPMTCTYTRLKLTTELPVYLLPDNGVANVF